MKKFLSLMIATVLLFAFTACPLTASAIITGYSGVIAVLPGNTRSSNPEYNYAWLDNVIVRDDAMAVTSSTLVPKPDDYIGSHTYDEFIKEAEQYSVIFDIDENTVAAGYSEVTRTLYYLVVAMGMTDELPAMRQYLQDYGIRLPASEGAEDAAEVSVVYAAIKYNAVYTLYGKEAVIPAGTTLEGALVIILSALTGTMLPSGINTLTGMAVNMVKTYVEQFEQLPVSANPDSEEVFHWAKVITAASNDYKVPVVSYDVASSAQKEYVDYAYYATVINAVYDISVNPIYLIIATQSEDDLALQKLILTTMLDEKEVSYDRDLSCEELFNLASQYGCFALEEEFYSDILTYEITVAENCEKIWFTPFALAGQLDGGSDDRVSIMLGDTLMKPSATVGVELNKNLNQEEITMSVAYVDDVRNDNAVYRFIVKKDPALNNQGTSDSKNDMVAGVEEFVNTIVPTDNEKVSEIVDSVFNAVDNKLEDTAGNDEGILTTFDVSGESVTGKAPQVSTTSGYEFDYLEDLFAGLYATDADGNIITTTSFFGNTADETTTATFAETVSQAVKENPGIVVAPTSLAALGSIAGFLMAKKKRSSVLDEEELSEEAEEE